MKKIINSIVAITIVISILIVLSNTVLAATQEIQLTLGKAQETVSNNNSVKLIDNQIANAQKRLDYAKRKAQITDDSWNTDAKRAEIKKIKELTPVQKGNALAVLKLQKNEQMSSLKLDISKGYFEYIFTEEKVQSQINSISRLNKKLNILKAQVAAGGELKSAVEETEVAIKTAEQQKDLIERDLNNLAIDLNSLLGRTLSSKISLVKQEVPFYEVDKIDTKKILNDRVAQSSSILKALNNWNEAKIEYNIVNFSSTQMIPNGLEEAEDKVLTAEYDYNQLLSDEENNVMTEYNSLLNLRDDIDIKKMESSFNQKQMNVAKVKYNNGYIDIVTYNDAIQKYEDSVIAYKQAKLDYYLESEKFQK